MSEHVSSNSPGLYVASRYVPPILDTRVAREVHEVVADLVHDLLRAGTKRAFHDDRIDPGLAGLRGGSNPTGVPAPRRMNLVPGIAGRLDRTIDHVQAIAPCEQRLVLHRVVGHLWQAPDAEVRFHGDRERVRAQPERSGAVVAGQDRSNEQRRHVTVPDVEVREIRATGSAPCMLGLLGRDLRKRLSESGRREIFRSDIPERPGLTARHQETTRRSRPYTNRGRMAC